MKTTRFLTKSLSIFLAMLMTILLVPLSVYAEIFDFPEHSVSNDTNYSEALIKPDVYELIDRREENVKHFKLSDGTVTAVMYDYPVHYVDSDGEWQDIDNTLSDNGSEYTNPNTRVKFAKKTTGNGVLFTLQENNTKITIGLNGANKKVSGQVTNTVTEHGKDATELQKQMTLDKLSSRILYPDILNGVDLEYVVNSGNIKENIIVKEKLDVYSYSFTISLNDLTANLHTDGSILLKNSLDEIVYTIPSGYMYDANGEYSEAVEYTLQDLGNDKYTLTVTADASWINSTDRAFPVTIDPPIVSDKSSITDLYISSASPSTSYAGEYYLYVGSGYMTYLMLNSLPTLPSGAYVTSANVSIKCLNSHDGYSVGVYKVATAWSSTLTWSGLSNAEGHLSLMLDYVDLNPDLGRGYRYYWDITSVAKEWYNGVSSNNGVCFAVVDGSIANSITAFYSTENSSVGYAPSFTINYRDMKGLESYWTQISQDVGLAGAGSVNVATGNLTFLQSTVTSTDGLFGYTPTFVYNSALAGKAYTYANSQVPQSSSYMPNGFKMSINETLIRKSYTSPDGISEYYYVWADSDGTEHSFFSVNGSTTEYKDEDGLQLTLSFEGTYPAITDQSHTVRQFEAIQSPEYEYAWHLKKIIDKNGNSLNFTFDSNKRPVSISVKPMTSSSIEQLRIVYNDGGVPAVIYRPWSGGEAMIFKYSDTATGSANTSSKTYLREAIYIVNTGSAMTDAQWLEYYEGTLTNSSVKTNATAYYTYNSSGRLTSAKDGETGYEVRYSYTSGQVYIIQEYASNETEGQKIRFVYYDSYTMVRSSGADDVYGNSDDVMINYTLDGEGRVTSSYSSNPSKTEIYGVSTGEYVSDNEMAKNSLKTAAHSNGSNSANYLLNGGFESGLDCWNHSLRVDVFQSLSGSNALIDHEAEFSVSTGAPAFLIQYVFLRPGNYSLSLDIPNSLHKKTTLQIKVISRSTSNKAFEETVVDGKEVGAYHAFLDFDAIDAGSGGELFEVQIIVTAGSNVTSATVSIDDIMIAKAMGEQNYNMVNNGSFENTGVDSSGTTLYTPSDFWSMSSDSASTSVNVVDFTVPFESSLYLTGNVGSTMRAEQVIYSVGNYDFRSGEPRVLTVSGFGRATQALSGDKGIFALRLEVTYNTIYGDVTDIKYFNFSKETDAWQYVSGQYIIPENPDVKEIKICCEYTNIPGSAYFDEISVMYNPDGSNIEQYYYYEDTGKLGLHVVGDYATYYTYDENGNVAEVLDINGKTEYMYSENNNIVTETHSTYSGIFIFHRLIENGQLTENQDQLNDVNATLGTFTVKMESVYSYNGDGLPVETYTVDPTDIILSSSSTYTSDSVTYGSIATETDTLGRTTRYFYESGNGRLIAIINPDGSSGTVYDYNDFGRLTTVRPSTYSGGTPSAQTNAESVEYTYSGGRLTAIETNSTKYTLSYDVFGNNTTIKAGNYKLATYTYNANNGKLASITYGNGFKESYTYDALDRIETVLYNDVVVHRYNYDSAGNINRFEDLANGKVYEYKYDLNNQLSQIYEENSNGYKVSLTYVFYDEKSRPTLASYYTSYAVGSTNSTLDIQYTSTYDENGSIKEYEVRSGSTEYTFDSTYDSIGRVTQRIASLSVSSGTLTNTVSYQFTSNEVSTSMQISGYTSKINSTTTNTYQYVYDNNGNITQIKNASGTVQYKYTYDDLGQLIREDNRPLNKSYTYTYDLAGNITSRKEYAFTTGTLGTATNTQTYTYGNVSWGDRLTAINGNSITYDTIGNPLTYYIGGLSSTLTWTNGRQLASVGNSKKDVYYTYNDEGIRLSKTANGSEHIYQLNGTQIISETWAGETIFYIYDENGAIAGMRYRTSSYAEGVFDEYLFEKNLQGDVVAVYNASGTKLVGYTYDAWGKVTTTYYNGGDSTSAQYNPFRYRGYYYDEDTGFYYINSRYYDPSVGRFISADGVIAGAGGSIQGYNMFAYCFNNPVSMSDPSGSWPKWIETAVNWINKNIIQIVSNFIENVVEDIDNYDWKNQSEDVVFSSNYFSSYKGVLVIKTPFDASFSFGFIGLSILDQEPEALKHEYGHAIQMKIMGLRNYVTNVAIPSITINILDRQEKLPYDYYSYPWEAEANLFGGSTLYQSGKPPLPQGGYNSYWDLLRLFFE